MNTILLLLAAALAPWQDPQVNEINRLPARAVAVPCETEQLAFDILSGDAQRDKSRWIIPLDGDWDFKWKSAPSLDWEKEAKIKVPSCWQLQGEYDPALYVNITYPIAMSAPDPMREPNKEYTSFKYRNPVGLYKTTFKRPWRWWFRRTVIHFNGVSSAFYVRVNGKEVGYSEDSRLPVESILLNI
jgi:beta-galactosidase